MRRRHAAATTESAAQAATRPATDGIEAAHTPASSASPEPADLPPVARVAAAEASARTAPTAAHAASGPPQAASAHASQPAHRAGETVLWAQSRHAEAHANAHEGAARGEPARPHAPSGS